jgi:hypothetical protein
VKVRVAAEGRDEAPEPRDALWKERTRSLVPATVGPVYEEGRALVAPVTTMRPMPARPLGDSWEAQGLPPADAPRNRAERGADHRPTTSESGP